MKKNSSFVSPPPWSAAIKKSANKKTTLRMPAYSVASDELLGGGC